MHRFRFSALAAVAVFGFASVASAADMPVKAPVYRAPVYVPYNWTGFYIGGNIGGGWSNTNLTNTVSDGAIAWPDLAPGQGISYNHSGVVGGGQIGVNFQSSSWVYGLELLVSAANIKATVQNPYTGPPFSAGDDVFSTKINTLLLATARIGYAWDRSLLYVKGGYAGANVRVSVSDNVCSTPNNCGAGSDSNWRSGFTVGAGVEYAVTNNWIVGVEYDFARLGSASVNLGDATARYVFNDAERDVNMVLGRVSYKFGGWN
jgi:outer membrane immunogenic protein